MSHDDDEVAVYFGEGNDSLFLKMLLEGSGIPATVRNFSVSGPPGADVRVLVAARDVDRARPLVEHFKQHGHR